jgi:hypothetical protein
MERRERGTRATSGPRQRMRWLAIGTSIPLVLGVLTGCNHVPLDAEAEGTRVIDQNEAASCERVGNTQVKVLSKIVGIKRGEEKMSKELTTLARNAAVEMNGNAVMAEGEISDGGQKFAIYRCP